MDVEVIDFVELCVCVTIEVIVLAVRVLEVVTVDTIVEVTVLRCVRLSYHIVIRMRLTHLVDVYWVVVVVMPAATLVTVDFAGIV